jgi:hypothetical protein
MGVRPDSIAALADEFSLRPVSAREARKRLEKHCEDRVFVFEHLTLTESPICNPLELARRFPKEGGDLLSGKRLSGL